MLQCCFEHLNDASPARILNGSPPIKKKRKYRTSYKQQSSQHVISVRTNHIRYHNHLLRTRIIDGWSRWAFYRTSDRWSVWSVWSVWPVWSAWSRSSRQGRCVPHLYDLAHVTGCEPYNLYDLAHVSWVVSVLYRSCTAPQNGRLGSRWSRSWSVRRMIGFLLGFPLVFSYVFLEMFIGDHCWSLCCTLPDISNKNSVLCDVARMPELPQVTTINYPLPGTWYSTSELIGIAVFAIRQCAAWTSTLITHTFPERRKSFHLRWGIPWPRCFQRHKLSRKLTTGIEYLVDIKNINSDAFFSPACLQ